jgi:predicted PurR-regulated permease PerM
VAARLVTLGVLLACIVLLGATFYQVIAPFLLPLFLAAILAVLCQPIYLRILCRVGNRASVAAGLTTALVMLVVVTPVVFGTFIGATELTRLTQEKLQNWDWSRGLDLIWTDYLEPALIRVQAWYPGEMEIEQIKKNLATEGQSLIQSLGGRTLSWASSTVGAAMSLLISGTMLLVAFYYFLADGPALVAAAERLIPLPAEHQRRLCDQFAKVVRAVVLATFLAAFAQGIATTVALQVVGMGHFFVFLIAATIASLVPLAGTWMIWGPCAAWLAFQGHWTAAIGLSLFGIVVVGLLDNVIRTYVLNSDAQLHPLLAFVSVLGALQVMGLWGIFFGPMVASCLYALVQIFNAELTQLSVRAETPPVRAELPAAVLPAAASPAGEGVTGQPTLKAIVQGAVEKK